ncbi:MAG: uracil-DNA glycosylase [Chloracidobacterium sp.]
MSQETIREAARPLIEDLTRHVQFLRESGVTFFAATGQAASPLLIRTTPTAAQTPTTPEAVNTEPDHQTPRPNDDKPEQPTDHSAFGQSTCQVNSEAMPSTVPRMTMDCNQAAMTLPGQRQDSLFGEAFSLPSPPPTDKTLEEIQTDLGDCQRCKLAKHRRHIVFGEGSPQARLVFVGEGPGADEDATGRPFVGRAGQLLDKIIAAMGLRREAVYICNVVKCRPPENRTPERDEVAACVGFLHRQLAVIGPDVIVALGASAASALLGDPKLSSISKIRGQFHDYRGIPLMPTFHPAYLLRSPDKKREVWDDMKQVMAKLKASTGARL